MTPDCQPDDESLPLPTLATLQARNLDLEQRLRQQALQYKAVAQQVNSLILQWTTSGEVQFVNPYGRQCLGLNDTAKLGSTGMVPIVAIGALTSNDMQRLLAELQQDPTQPIQHQAEIMAGHPHHWVSWVHQGICDDRGEIVTVLTIGHDLTAQKQAEEKVQALLAERQETQAYLVQSEKMSSLGQLVAGVAHEINNPVNFIHGNINPASQYVQDLLDLIDLYQSQGITNAAIQAKEEEIDLEFLMADLPKIINSMKVGADRIREIVVSLRNFSRLDDSELKETDIHAAIDGTLVILRNRLRGHGMPQEFANLPNGTIVVVQNYGSVPLVPCLPGQLSQVFLNILANAIDALEAAAEARVALNSPEAITSYQPTIWITTEVVDNQQVRIRIADNAQGITDEVQRQIFEPFFTTKPIGKGTGLGMSISHQIIVERHHGRLSCQSVLDQGTEFTIELPL